MVTVSEVEEQRILSLRVERIPTLEEEPAPARGGGRTKRKTNNIVPASRDGEQMNMRDFSKARRVVVKVGSSTLTHESGLL